MKYNIIGDIAGQYDTLMALLNKMPKNYTIAVGDLVDRGPKSKEVLEYFVSLEAFDSGTALFGNHECLMLDYLEETGIYDNLQHPWLFNGGFKTLSSFDMKVPNRIIDWLKKRPRFKKLSSDYFVSHSFIHHEKQLKDVLTRDLDMAATNIFWNRGEPIRREFFQIAGHNSHWGLRWLSDELGDFALGIDTSGQKVLTGIVIDTDLTPCKENIQIYQHSYIEENI